MSKRADALAQELDATRARMVKTVADLNNFLSPLAILARNAEKISKFFSADDQTDNAPKSSNAFSQVFGVVTAALKKPKEETSTTSSPSDEPE